METTPAVCNVHRDVLPIIPPGLEIHKHNARDAKWDPSKVKLIALPPEWSDTEDFFAVDEEGKFFNASMALALLQSSQKPNLFLDEWRNKIILFMDTVYAKNSVGRYIIVLQHDTHTGWYWQKRKCSVYLLNKVKELLEESLKIEA